MLLGRTRLALESLSSMGKTDTRKRRKEDHTVTNNGSGLLTSILIGMVRPAILLAIFQNTRPQRSRIALTTLPAPLVRQVPSASNGYTAGTRGIVQISPSQFPGRHDPGRGSSAGRAGTGQHSRTHLPANRTTAVVGVVIPRRQPAVQPRESESCWWAGASRTWRERPATWPETETSGEKRATLPGTGISPGATTLWLFWVTSQGWAGKLLLL